MNTTGQRAVVLGGGGVAGVGWEAGLLTGLREQGVDLGGADVIVGTSAGSIVGSYVASGHDPATVLDRMNDAGTRAPQVAVDMDRVMAAMAITFDETRDPLEARAEVGRLALEAAPDHSTDQRDNGVRELVPWPEWPQRRLLVTAVDTADGAFTVWDAASGVPLPDAVASSCAVPCAFPPVTINGRRYMDGGVRSVTNADLAAGADTVVVIEPMAHVMPRTALERELAALGEAAEVVTVGPDAASAAAFGVDVLDHAVGAPSFAAGRAQAAAVAEEIAAVW